MTETFSQEPSKLDALINQVASAHGVDADELKAAYSRAAFEGASTVNEDFERAVQLADHGARASSWKDALKRDVALPVIARPTGIARQGERTILKHERKQFADRLCGTLVAGRRLNRRDRRFVARQVKFA